MESEEMNTVKMWLGLIGLCSVFSVTSYMCYLFLIK